METKKVDSKETRAYSIAIFVAAIIFIVLLNHLPFPESYGFWNLAGIFVTCCAIGGIIFATAASLVHALFKVIIEIIVVLLLLFNVSYVSLGWVFLDSIILEMDLDTEKKLIHILILAAILFLIDLVAVIILLPFSRIANSEVLDY